MIVENENGTVRNHRIADLRGHVVRIYDDFATVDVPSTREGQFYSVIVTKDKLECECKGYIYRFTCRHVTFVGQLIRDTQPVKADADVQ